MDDASTRIHVLFDTERHPDGTESASLRHPLSGTYSKRRFYKDDLGYYHATFLNTPPSSFEVEKWLVGQGLVAFFGHPFSLVWFRIMAFLKANQLSLHERATKQQWPRLLCFCYTAESMISHLIRYGDKQHIKILNFGRPLKYV